MKLRDTKIGHQLILTFIAIFIFFSTIGIIAILDSNISQSNMNTFFQHPYEIRRAISTIRIAVTDLQLQQRDLSIVDDETLAQKILDQISLDNLEILDNIDILDSLYLGSHTDILAIKQDYALWKEAYDSDTQLISDGNSSAYTNNILVNGRTDVKIDSLYSAVKIVDDYAQTTANSLYLSSIKKNNELFNQMLITIFAIFVLLGLIGYYLIRNIKKPIMTINEAVEKFHNGEMNSRIKYNRHNEFGVITESINKMADKVQLASVVSDRINNISRIMLSEEDTNQFFRKTLAQLMVDTNAQIAAVYSYNPINKMFEYLISIGGTQEIKQSFSATDFEGELGLSFASRKVSIVKNISDQTRFVYKTGSGKLLPHEIMTIPVISKQELVAVISLVTLDSFDEIAFQFIESIVVTMGIRIEGVLAAQEIKQYKETLERANFELQENEKELSIQTVELIQQNTELEIQKNQLDEASKLKTSFLSNMSHELRTPLNSVIALSGILNRRLENKVSPEEYEYLEIIERNGKNLLALINDILDISRIEAGREEITLNSFDMVKVIDEMADLIRPQAEVKNITLTTSSEHKELRIYSDIKKIQHILQNIIGNAVKFTEEGSVKVTSRINEDQIEIIVTDTGIGISETNIPSIFDEFKQADGSTSRRYGGTGLGLAIAKKYALLLKGNIVIRSELNIGSSFILRLPILFEANSDTSSQEDIWFESTPQPNQNTENFINKTVLLVDDNETALIQIRDLLSETGIHVLTASNAQEAFVIINKVIPDAMVLDLMMPEMDGFKVLEILRNAPQTAHIPVLILTAKHINKEELKSLKQNNVHELILKGSVKRESLQNAIGSMLNDKQNKKAPPMIRHDSVKPLVLVVEDNPDNMTTVKAMLGEQYKILEAINGKEAILLAKSALPDLILMDIALPIVNGIDAYKKIRTMRALDNTPIIALTASAMEHDRESILLHGFDAFIAKPINAKEFYSVIDEVLYGR